MLRSTSVVITTIGASPLIALSPVSRPTVRGAVRAHEVAVLLVRQRLQRRRVEGLAARRRARARSRTRRRASCPSPVGAATSTDRPASSASSAPDLERVERERLRRRERARGRLASRHGARGRSASPVAVVVVAARSSPRSCPAARRRRRSGGVVGRRRRGRRPARRRLVVAQQAARPEEPGDDRGDEDHDAADGHDDRRPGRASGAAAAQTPTTRTRARATSVSPTSQLARGWRLHEPAGARGCRAGPGRSSQISERGDDDDRRPRPPTAVTMLARGCGDACTGRRLLRAGLIVSSTARSGSRAS